MKIAQISDLHMVATGATLGRADMAAKLRAVVARLNGLAPDAVLVSGDIAQAGGVAESARAAQILAGLEMPYYLTPGNHDSREALRRTFPAAALPTRPGQGHLSYCITTPALRLIALDSTDPDTPNGRICPARAEWLAQILGESTAPALIFMHHPPVKFGVEESDAPPLEGVERLAGLVAAHPQILRILCGHIHLSAQSLWQGRLVIAAPSIGMRLSWNPTRLHPSQFFDSPPAFLLHMHNADGGFVSHEITLDTAPGPFPFS